MNLNQNKELSANTTVSHYRIVSKLGAGGMGVVWLAEDTRLGRKVALKLLPAEFTEDSERVRRFTQEAKAASALNHPNIISVYDIGECDTGRFIVMEFVDGRTLRSVIAKDNSLETLFTLGAQMARALSAAHAAGITHRDIKPDNIMVRDDGYVKMLDFGLARLLPTTASDPEAMTLAQQTTPGTVMGTLAYMSPEQASGKTAGSASDVFALGIVLYELATGSHPFKSETMIGYLHAITSQTPPSITSLKSHLPASVQLVDANTGAHIWAETYDRQFRAEEIFALQDDLVPRIVSTVADINGVLPRSMCEVVCSRSPDQLSPYEAVLRSFRYFDRVSPDELAAARSCLELAVEKAPTYADAWAMLALLCVQDYAQGFNLQSDSLKQGTIAAQRAVEAGPSNHLAYFSLAQVHFFHKELKSFRNAAERGVALNPMDGNSLAFVGELLTYAGDSERGLALATRAKQINPNHPGWFWYADYFHAYRQGDYREALSLILKANLPGHWGMHAGIAAAAGQLGEPETASKAVRDLLKLQPDFCATVHNTFAKWFDPELRERLIDGLRKAGLEIADEGTESQGDASTGSVSVPGNSR